MTSTSDYYVPIQGLYADACHKDMTSHIVGLLSVHRLMSNQPKHGKQALDVTSQVLVEGFCIKQALHYHENKVVADEKDRP